MSLQAVMARVAEIEGLLGVGSLAPLPAPGTLQPGRFQRQLEQASAAGPASAATAPASGLAAPGSGPGAATPFAAEIDSAAAKHGVDPALLRALIRQESNFNPRAGSPAGAQGLTQLMPGTAAALGVKDPFDPAQAIEGGARYLRQQLDAFGGDVEKALAAYNAGPGAVKRHGGVPPYAETRNYVQKVLAYAEEYRRAAGAASTV